MKASRLLDMSESHEVGIELEASPPSTPRIGQRVFPHRIHSRSASWSFTGGQRPGSRVASLNPITPITSVIREFVGQERDRDSASNLGMSRSSSEVSVPLARGASYDDELSDTPLHHHLGFQQDGRGWETGDRLHYQPPPVNDEQNIGFEVSDGIRWLEQNAIFIILLLVKFAWYHRSGMTPSCSGSYVERRILSPNLQCLQRALGHPSFVAVSVCFTAVLTGLRDCN